MTKKIVYIVPLELNSSSSRGVIKKVRQQSQQWISQGKEVVIAYISNSTSPIDLLEHERYFSFGLSGKGFLPIYFNRILSTFKVVKLIGEFEPDLIYTRYTMYWPFSNALYRKRKSVVEMNTNDIVEYKKSSAIFNFVYKILRAVFLKTKNGAVCVSPEILETLEGAKLSKICLPNSYDFSKVDVVEPYSHSKMRNKRIVFISSPNQPWQGIDKILHLAESLPDYHFDIIGWEQSGYDKKDNVCFHGFLGESDYDAIMNKASYAIGPLALHRKSMNTTSALKTSKYLSHNLPVLQSYHEVGLDIDAILVLENKEDNINSESIEVIRNFFDEWQVKNVDLKEIKKMVGVQEVEEKRLEFFDLIA